jgi:hypothetical protein
MLKLLGALLSASALGLAMVAAIPTAVVAAAESQPTFTKDVLPIVQRSCQHCHRPGTSAPMSLLTYEEVRPWARAIKQRVVTRQMPPWHADRSIGEYVDDVSLSDAEVATIATWVDSGMPQGNPADAPPARKFTSADEWAFGEPDLVVEMKKGFTIPATGPDSYPEEIVDPGITEDRYIKWVQIIPTAHCCVHHSHVWARLPEGAAGSADDGFGVGNNRDDEIDLIEYATGNDADFYADGTAKILKAGSVFRFTPHYHPYGKEIHDRQKVGIKFYPKGVVPKYVVTSQKIVTGSGQHWALNRDLITESLLRRGYPLKIDEVNDPQMPTGRLLGDKESLTLLSIPPNTVARHERYFPLPQPAMVISFQPHMHLRGSRMLLEAIHPDGRQEVLTDVTRYEQNWQITYTYKEPHLFPAGTILHVVSWHDNTANNKHNPDPTAWIGHAQRTMDEMGNGWTDLVWLTQAQYEEELAQRAAKKQQRTN